MCLIRTLFSFSSFFTSWSWSVWYFKHWKKWEYNKWNIPRPYLQYGNLEWGSYMLSTSKSEWSHNFSILNQWQRGLESAGCPCENSSVKIRASGEFQREQETQWDRCKNWSCKSGLTHSLTNNCVFCLWRGYHPCQGWQLHTWGKQWDAKRAGSSTAEKRVSKISFYTDGLLPLIAWKHTM